jgi:hypothetical protein
VAAAHPRTVRRRANLTQSEKYETGRFFTVNKPISNTFHVLDHVVEEAVNDGIDDGALDARPEPAGTPRVEPHVEHFVGRAADRAGHSEIERFHLICPFCAKNASRRSFQNPS